MCVGLIQASSEQRTEGPTENVGDEEACKDATDDQRIEVRFRSFHAVTLFNASFIELYCLRNKSND